MTKLEQIVKRAKQIRLAQPNKFSKWTDYVKYASKDLADKVVGKKKTVGKANLLPFPKEKKQTGKSNTEYDRRKQAMAPGKRKASPAAKKPYYYESRANRSDKGKLLGMHKDRNSHNVKIKVISGYSELSSGAKKQYEYITNSRMEKYMDIDSIISYLYDNAVKKKQNKKASDLYELKQYFNSKY